MAPSTPIHLLMMVCTLFTTTHIARASWVQTSLQSKAPTHAHHNLTKLHFFFHDVTGGRDRSVALIARPENSTSYGFGSLVMIDDPLTEGPNRKASKLIGKAQGMYGLASLTDPVLHMTMTFCFLEGGYKGSTVSILGRYNVADGQREMPIIGGSGVFRFATGYAIAKPYKSNRNDEDTAEYNVFVLHSDASFM